MAATPVGLSGTIDGRAVRWYYKTQEDGPAEERMLSWAEENVSSPESDSKHIHADNMIAVVPKDETETAYTVLYVVGNEAKDDPGASPVILQSFNATELPEDFINDYSVPSKSILLDRAEKSGDDRPGSQNFQVILSTGSGTGKAQDVYDKLVEPLLAHFCAREKYHLHTTGSDQDIAKLVDVTILPRASDGQLQHILLLSGDGGVIDIVNGLLKRPHRSGYVKPTLALLPCGSGNALANSARVNNDATLGLRTFLRGVPREIPIFTTTFSPGARLLTNEARTEVPLPPKYGRPTTYGTVVVSWGFHASIVADSDTSAYRAHGTARFQMAANEHLYPSHGGPPHAYNGQVTVLRPGNAEWQNLGRSHHGYVVATLCSHFEKTFHISPANSPLDGKLHLIQFEPLSGDETMKIMMGAYDDGRHFEDDRVGYEPIVGMRIDFFENDPQWRRVCVDGKIIRVEKGGWAEVNMGGVEPVLDLFVDAQYAKKPGDGVTAVRSGSGQRLG